MPPSPAPGSRPDPDPQGGRWPPGPGGSGLLRLHPTDDAIGNGVVVGPRGQAEPGRMPPSWPIAAT